LGPEFVVKVTGKVVVRPEKMANKDIPTGEIEVCAEHLEILNASEVPVFEIEEDVDVSEDLRLTYRYLDIRRKKMLNTLEVRHKLCSVIHEFLNKEGFLQVETPFLTKSTPEGARDFVVPSRIHRGCFYALPQSPQVFKQLLMVAGYDRYFQIVKCFRDEDFRADRQPEFTQIDCEMAFVEQEDILNLFEGLIAFLLKEIKGFDISQPIPRLSYEEAMENYGCDKPDIRFDMRIKNISEVVKGNGFKVFDDAEFIGAICVEGAGEYSRKQLDALTNFVKKPQIGAKGMVYVKCNADGSFKSSVDKFYAEDKLKEWADATSAKAGDLLLVLSGDKYHTLNALCELRLEMGNQLGLRDRNTFAPLWVVDFPLLEWDEDTARFYAKHHPFTSPKKEDISLIDSDPGKVRANAYDFVLNGSEIGGGSIRIYDEKLQKRMFELLDFSDEEAQEQFGFLMNAFKYGAPPHGGIAFGFDRIAAILSGTDSIRDVIAFPKNNAGRDVMIDSPSLIDETQLKELNLQITKKED